MYAYRYRHLKKKKINGAVWLGGLLLAVIGILLQTNRSFFAKLGEEGAKSCCEKVLDFYLPGLSYSVKDETEWSFVEKVIDVLFSGENYEPESGSYQTQIESDLSYEAILAREAADENYVDEKTGEVIPSVDKGKHGFSGLKRPPASSSSLPGASPAASSSSLAAVSAPEKLRRTFRRAMMGSGEEEDDGGLTPT